MRPTAPSHHRGQGTGDATRDWHGHPPHFRGGGFLGGGPAPSGRANRLTRSGLEGFGRSLSKEDEVVVEATGNAMAVVRVYVARVIVANPLSIEGGPLMQSLKICHIADKLRRLVRAPARMRELLPRSRTLLPHLDHGA